MGLLYGAVTLVLLFQDADCLCAGCDSAKFHMYFLHASMNLEIVLEHFTVGQFHLTDPPPLFIIMGARLEDAGRS
jgi:hypothetical protein